MWSHYTRFPSTWPVYTPAKKFAGWLEHYAESMEIPVWTSTSVARAIQLEDKKWKVILALKDGEERELLVNHLIFATGMGGGLPKTFDYPGLVRHYNLAPSLSPLLVHPEGQVPGRIPSLIEIQKSTRLRWEESSCGRLWDIR